MVGLEASWGALAKLVGMGDSVGRNKLTNEVGFGECRSQVKPLVSSTSVPRSGEHSSSCRRSSVPLVSRESAHHLSVSQFGITHHEMEGRLATISFKLSLHTDGDTDPKGRRDRQDHSE